MYAERYADAFFDAVQALGVKRVVVVGGRLRCDAVRQRSRDFVRLQSARDERRAFEPVRRPIFQLRRRDDHRHVSRRPSGIAGASNSWSSTVLCPRTIFRRFRPPSRGSASKTTYKAWYDLLNRFNHMFDLSIDLSELEAHSDQLAMSIEAEIDKLDEQDAGASSAGVHRRRCRRSSREAISSHLGDMWTRGLADLFSDDGECISCQHQPSAISFLPPS